MMKAANMDNTGVDPINRITEDNMIFSDGKAALAMIRSIPSPVTYISNDYRYRFVNKAYADWMGMEPNEINGRLVEEFLGIEAFSRIKPFMDEALNGKRVHYEEQIIFRQGPRFIEATYTPDFDEQGAIKGYFALINDVTDRKNIEKELNVRHEDLKNSREHYEKLLANLPAAVYTTDKEGYITFYNEAAEKIWGRSPVLGKEKWSGFSKIYRSDGVTVIPFHWTPMAMAVKESRKIKEVELEVECVDGTRKKILPNAEPLIDESGSTIGAINMLIDVTEVKEADEYKARFAAIVKYSDDVIISTTTEGIITSWNPAACRLYGYKADEVVGKSISFLMPAGSIDEEPSILEKIKKGIRVEPFETKRVTKNGTLVDVSISISPIKDKYGNVIGASKIARNISDQKQNEEVNARLAAIVQSSDDAIVGKTLEGIITSWNSSAERLFGYKEQEIIGQSVTKLIPPDRLDEEPGILERLKRGEKVDHFETKRITKDGKFLDLSLTISPIKDSSGNIIGASKIARDITRQKEIGRLIQESEERFRMAVEATGLGTWDYQLLTGKLVWSTECRKIFDVPPDMEVDFDFFTEHIYPEDRPFAEAEIKKALDPKGEGIYDIQYRILRYSDKQIRWIKTTGKAIFNEGQAERFTGAILDITKEKLQQQELIESVELFQTMAENVPAMIWMSGNDKFNDYFNKTWLQFTGRSLEEESNEGWLNNVHPDDRHICIDSYNESLRKQEGFYSEYRLRRHDGQYRWIADNSVPRYSLDGSFLGFISACIDIDDQKRFREKIEESELLFKTISNTSPAALWMTDENRNNTFVSNTWLKWTGRSFQEEITNSWLSAVHEEDKEKLVNRFLENFAERKPFLSEFRLPLPDGGIKWCLTEGKPYFDINGGFAGYAGSVTDITELKSLEQRKDDFIKMASHELKTPITSINGYVQLLLNIYQENEGEALQLSRNTVKSSLGTIAKQVAKLTRLISELLDLSKIESGRLELHCTRFDLTELVEEVVQDIRHTTTRHAIIVESSFDGKMTGDRDRIGQVLMNLLNNAIKYSPDADNIKVYLEGNRKTASVKIKDYGIGIDKKYFKKIFERFYRVEGKTEQTYPGFGIGLFIAGEIIQRHDGTIDVSSEKGKGSIFTINLPLDFHK